MLFKYKIKNRIKNFFLFFLYFIKDAKKLKLKFYHYLINIVNFSVKHMYQI